MKTDKKLGPAEELCTPLSCAGPFIGKHVLCETPIALTKEQSTELHRLAEEKKCILMDSIKTAYSTAYSRMLLLAKSGKIGKIVSIDATATSLRDIELIEENKVMYGARQGAKYDPFVGAGIPEVDLEADFMREMFDYIPQEPYRRTNRKVGANEPCPCGSGKKFKKCCRGNGKYD